MLGCAAVASVSGTLESRLQRTAVVLLLLCAARVGAQVNPAAGWRTLHTPHFRIHFRPAARAAALLEAREAERAYELLGGELHPPRGVVDLVLSDDGDASNGSATPFPSNRIVVYLPPPATELGLERYDRWLRLATTHELTHIFHLDRVRSFWSVLQTVFGRVPGLFPNEYQPTWVVEGLAVYYESKFTNGGRVNGSFHTQVLASEAAAHRARSPSNALLFSRWPGGVAPYAYGSRFWSYLADSLGDSVIPRFTEATAGQLIPFRVGRELARAVPGLSLAAAWPRATRPAPAAPGRTRSVALDSGLWAEPVPRVSPDGRRVAYLRNDGKDVPEIRIVSADGWRPLRSHRVNDEASYDWVGDTLVVSQFDFTSRWRVRSDLYRWLPDGRWERVTHGARLREPRGGAGRLSAIALLPGTNHPTLLSGAGDLGVTWGDVVPSPDGRWVAATRNAQGHWSLVRWPTSSPDRVHVLLASRDLLCDPVWTPTGALLYVSDQTGFPQVYRWRDAATPVALTAEPFGARAPAALPDGTLLYAALGTSRWAVRRAAPDSLAPARPVAAPLPLDSAPVVPTRETGYDAWPSLRPHFWIPLGLDEGPAGLFWGAATGGSDALGRYTYLVNVLASGAPLRAGGGFSGASNLLGNPSLDVQLSSAWSPTAQVAATVVSERDQDAALGATFLFPRWRRTVRLRLAAEYEGTHFVARPAADPATICSGCVDQDLIGGSVTLGVGWLTGGALAVSPEDGFQWLGLYRRREEQGTTRWSNEWRSQLALYAHLPGLGGFAHHVLAVRLSAGAFTGPLPKLYGVGGVATGPIAVGLGQSLGAGRDFPVRGYPSSTLRGRRAVTTTVEYRLPLALVGETLGHLPVGADKLSLALFGDAGDAWNPGTTPRLTRLASAGAELVADLTFNYDAPLRLRVGVAEPLVAAPGPSARQPQVYFALGSTF
jgi:WD40-like Beta Propeller Repeat